MPAMFCYLAYFFMPFPLILYSYLKHRSRSQEEIQIVSFAYIIGMPGYFLANMFFGGALLESIYVLTAAASFYRWKINSQIAVACLELHSEFAIGAQSQIQTSTN